MFAQFILNGHHYKSRSNVFVPLPILTISFDSACLCVLDDFPPFMLVAWTCDFWIDVIRLSVTRSDRWSCCDTSTTQATRFIWPISQITRWSGQSSLASVCTCEWHQASSMSSIAHQPRLRGLIRSDTWPHCCGFPHQNKTLRFSWGECPLKFWSSNPHGWWFLRTMRHWQLSSGFYFEQPGSFLVSFGNVQGSGLRTTLFAHL